MLSSSRPPSGLAARPMSPRTWATLRPMSPHFCRSSRALRKKPASLPVTRAACVVASMFFVHASPERVIQSVKGRATTSTSSSARDR